MERIDRLVEEVNKILDEYRQEEKIRARKLVEKVNLPVYGEMYVACADDVSIETMQVLQEPLKKLYDYEQKEEKGLLAHLQCKVGDTVWGLCKCDYGVYRIFPMQIKSIAHFGFSLIKKDGFPETWNIYAENQDRCTNMYKSFNDIGKTVFLTEEEAEQKLKEMGKDKED